MLRGIQQLAPCIGTPSNPGLEQWAGVDDGICRSPATATCWTLTGQGDSHHVRNAEFHLRKR